MKPDIKRSVKEIEKIARDYGFPYGTVASRYKTNRAATIQELTRPIAPKNKPRIINTGIEGCDCKTLPELSRKYGISALTLRHRYYDKAERGERLVRPPEQRGKPRIVEGRTFVKWSTYFVCLGWNYDATHFSNSYCTMKREKKMSDKAIVKVWKERYTKQSWVGE